MSVQSVMLDRFAALYGRPETPNPKLFIDEYIRAFQKADLDVLASAVDRVIQVNRYRSWPTIGDINRALLDVAEELDCSRVRQRLALPPPAEKAPTPAERAAVARLMDQFRAMMTEKTIGEWQRSR
jgi:hypothetical protein